MSFAFATSAPRIIQFFHQGSNQGTGEKHSKHLANEPGKSTNVFSDFFYTCLYNDFQTSSIGFSARDEFKYIL